MKALALGILLAAAPAHIDSVYPLQRFIAESEVIAEAVVEKADAATRTATARLVRSLKGRSPVEVFRLNLSAGRDWHPEILLSHLVPGAPLVVFSSAERRGEFYLNRYFLQCHGDPSAPADKAWWTFSHIELRCNRTFSGTAGELLRVVEEVLAGRRQAPKPAATLPAITKEALRALPPWGREADPSAPLAPCFRPPAPAPN
jgi:hypothetical protein